MEELIFIFIGILAGIFCGLIPGIHTNTIALILLLFAPKGDLNFVLLIVAMSVTQSFVDFIPSIIFGAPEEENFLSILPGHRFLLKGLGEFAIKLTILGGLFGGIIALLLLPIYLIFISKFVELISALIPLILVAVLILMISGEKGKKKFFAIIVIAFSGLLGVIVLKNFFPIENPLFPLVTGFFGLSTLIYSIQQKTVLPRQKIGKNFFNKKIVLKGSFLGAIAGGIVSFLPTLGPSQAAFIIRKFVGKIKSREYLVLLGGINSASMIFSFFVLYAIGKTRTGSAAAISQILLLQNSQLLPLIAVILFCLGFSAVFTLLISRQLIKGMHRINYNSLNKGVLAFLCILTFIFSGLNGLIALILATSIGLIALATGVKRTHSMAFLMIPTILIYLGI